MVVGRVDGVNDVLPAIRAAERNHRREGLGPRGGSV
jgi:hypothetical protein